jgi:hypothetical protein
MIDEKDILQKLVIDEKDVTKDMVKLVEEATKIFRIESPSGKIIFQNFGVLSDKNRLLVILTGKYFANRLDMLENASLSISDMAKELGRPMTTLSGPIRDLVKTGYVENLPGRKYRIAYHRIKEIFDDVLSSKQKK